MAENTFCRRIEIRDDESKEKLKQFLESEEPARKLTKAACSVEEREISKQLLKRCFDRK